MEQRVKMLHSLIPDMEAGKRKAIAVQTFLNKIKSLNNLIPSNTAIPMKQGYVFEDVISPKQAEVYFHQIQNKS
jgi:hypothetical protein